MHITPSHQAYFPSVYSADGCVSDISPFSWGYQLPVFNPVQVGRQTRNLAVTLELSANWYVKSITFLTLFVKKKHRSGHSSHI